jgi:predicted HNH restriction endonuclease
MEKFNLDSINTLIDEYSAYISTQVKSHSQYRDIIKEYLRNQVLNKIEINDYDEIFNSDRIKEFHFYRKSGLVRSTIVKFHEYLKYKGLLNSYLEYPDIPSPEKRPSNFLGIDDIEFIFSENIKYKDEEEKYISPLVYSLSFFCGFEQRHIINLKISDVIIEDRLIRNIRKNDSSYLMEWIELNDVVVEHLYKYFIYRDNLQTKFNELIIINHRPANNESLNQIFRVLGRKDNKMNRQSEINAQLLIKSMVLSNLISTNGQGINNILKLMDWNTHVSDAYNKYLINYARLHNRDEVIQSVSLLSIIDGFKNMEKIHNQDESFNDDVNEEIDIPENEISNYEFNLNQIVQYSEDDDLTIEDLINYDEGRNKNQSESKITIHRLVRDSNIANNLKELYNHKCQLCTQQLRNSTGGYMSEAHHIKPYNRTHLGDDTIKNLLVLCPNCHSQFDELYFCINPESLKVQCLFEDEPYNGIDLIFIEGHRLGKEYLLYTWNLFVEKKKTIEDNVKL